MLTILGITDFGNCHWVRVLSNGRRYTCPTRIVNGVLQFTFKNQTHNVLDYVSEHTTEFTEAGRSILRQRFKR